MYVLPWESLNKTIKSESVVLIKGFGSICQNASRLITGGPNVCFT